MIEFVVGLGAILFRGFFIDNWSDNIVGFFKSGWIKKLVILLISVAVFFLMFIGFKNLDTLAPGQDKEILIVCSLSLIAFIIPIVSYFVRRF
jgi:uncharacterized membrane protein